MSLGNRAKLGAYLMFAAVALLLFVTGTQLPGIAMRVLSAVPLLVTLLFGAYDRWLWRWPGIIRLAGRPLLVGTWCGSLTGYRVDPATHETVSTELDVVLAIAQTFTSTTVTLWTKTSFSRSITAEFIRHDPDSYTLFYTYDNTPDLAHRGELVVHRGCTVLTMQGLQPQQFEAEYWTNRDTKGTFSARRVAKTRASNFQEGQRLAAGNK